LQGQIGAVAKLVAIRGENGFQIWVLASDPCHEVFDGAALAMLRWCFQRQFRTLARNEVFVEPLQLPTDLLSPPPCRNSISLSSVVFSISSAVIVSDASYHNQSLRQQEPKPRTRSLKQTDS
jgi:hypothetical protein